ncbi:ArdC family protein [Bacteroides intestinalis]|jgi:antirestriction protein ArdC|nr:ArdC family protein [Bacteroides intestinalis]
MKYENNPMLERYVELMVEKLKEVNADDWQQPWFSPQFKGIPQNLSGRTYNNLNKAVLYFICDKYNYQTPVFITFNQAKSAGIQILKGSKAFPVMFYELSIKDKVTGQRIDRSLYESLSQADKERYKVMPFLKYYNVFNLDQTNFTKKSSIKTQK